MSKENQYARYLETLDKALKNVVETIGEGKVEFAGLPVEEWAGPGYAVAALFDPFVVSAKLRDSRIFLDFPAGADIPPGIVFHEKRNSQKERISFVAGGNRTAELQLPTLWGGVPWNRFETSAGWQELGRIAEYPAAAVRDGVAVFAFNPLRVIHRYLCMAKPETTAWLTDLMVEAILAASGLEATLDGNDLRRDFHSFGISVLMLEQMHRAAGKVWNAGEIQPGLRQAAEAYVAGDFPAAETGLKGLFQSLETRRRQLVPVPVYLIDMPHGGVLFDDEGYAEFDSPELAARVLNLYLDWNDKYHFHFAPDIGAATLEKFARLSPRTIERMRNAWSRGEIEFVNGTYSQPYLQLWPEWDQRKQFEIGQKTFDDIFGRHPTVYAAQEIAHHPALPGILNDYGFRYAVHRAQNLGNTPVDGSPLIDWRSPDGASIRTLPSHSLRSESYGSQFTRHLPFLLTDRKNNGLPFIAITSLMDQTFVDIYREEAARAPRYAPVWGEFVTPSEFFEKTRDLPAAGTSYTLDQYHYALDLDGNTIHGHQTGGYSSEHAFLFDESARLQRLEKNGKLPEDELRTHLNREGHDCYIIPYFAPGYFMEGLMTDYTGPRYRCVNDLPRGLDRKIGRASCRERV